MLSLFQFSLLAEKLAQERQEIQVRKKAQEKVKPVFIMKPLPIMKYKWLQYTIMAKNLPNIKLRVPKCLKYLRFVFFSSLFCVSMQTKEINTKIPKHL